MKRIGLGIIIAALGLTRVEGTLAPGGEMGSDPDSAPPFLLLAPHGDGEFSTPLPFSVMAGDVVILESSTGGIGTANWREVISFTDVGGHGLATTYVLPSFSGFVLPGAKTGEIEYLLQSGNAITTYTPGTGSPSPQSGPLGSRETLDSSETLGAGVTYEAITVGVAVPEPSTCIAGALLLLPFGVSIVRLVRKPRSLLNKKS